MKTKILCKATQATPRSERDAAHPRVERRAGVRPKLEQPSNREPDSDPPVQVVLAYDDDLAFQRTLGVYRAIAQRLAGSFKCRDSWWRFGAIANPDQLEQAAHLATVPPSVRNSVARLSEPVPACGEDLVVCHIETSPEVRHWGINE